MGDNAGHVGPQYQRVTKKLSSKALQSAVISEVWSRGSPCLALKTVTEKVSKDISEKRR